MKENTTAKAVNRWVITLTEDYIGRCAPNPYRYPLTPVNAHLFVDHLLQNELADEGFYAAAKEAAVTWLLAHDPSLADDPAFPHHIDVTYCHTRRGHIAPGADHLATLSQLQPPNAWTIEVTLASDVAHLGFTACIIPIEPPHDEE